MTAISNELVYTTLKDLRSDIAEMKTDIAVIKEHMGQMNLRLSAVESHMDGFMAKQRFLEGEHEFLARRVTELEEQRDPPTS